MAKKIRHNIERAPDPIVYVPFPVYKDMVWISQATKDEVSWFGEVEKLDDHTFLVQDVSVPRQQSSTSTVEIEPEDLESFALEYLEEYGPESYNRLRLWGHSHHTMSVTPSGQDQSMIDSLVNMVGDTFIAVRVNHKGEMAVDVAYTDGITVEDATYRVGEPGDERQKEWEAIVKDRVRHITYTTTYKGGKYPPGYGGSTYQGGKQQNGKQIVKKEPPKKITNGGGQGKGRSQGGSAAGGVLDFDPDLADFDMSGLTEADRYQLWRMGVYNPDTREMEPIFPQDPEEAAMRTTMIFNMEGTANPYVWDPQVGDFRRYESASKIAKDIFDDSITTNTIPDVDDIIDAWDGEDLHADLEERIGHFQFHEGHEPCVHDFVTILLEDGKYQTVCGHCLTVYVKGMPHLRQYDHEKPSKEATK